MVKENKKGWIKVTEAFISVLLLVAIMLVAVGKNAPQEDRQSEGTYDSQKIILMEVQLNSTLRNELLSTYGTVEWENFPQNTKNKIIEKTPPRMECTAKICTPEGSCLLSDSSIPQSAKEENIYTEKIMIASSPTLYNPRVLKLFCW
ncbi:MAG: hypothetical protein Q8P81_00145 [Nanoarchaeota archaeon]|nr:hypothetical protein [Nanoarchaeota archaeon]